MTNDKCGGECGTVDATICGSGRNHADERKSRLVTALVLRLLDTPMGVAKKELFAVKGRSGISR